MHHSQKVAPIQQQQQQQQAVLANRQAAPTDQTTTPAAAAAAGGLAVLLLLLLGRQRLADWRAGLLLLPRWLHSREGQNQRPLAPLGWLGRPFHAALQ
jgi:hypothetical protein